MKVTKMIGAEVTFLESENKVTDEYVIKITGSSFDGAGTVSATSYVNGVETGRFELTEDEVARIVKSRTSDEAFAVLEK